MLELEITGRTDLGRQRELNEDGFAYSVDADWTDWSTPAIGGTASTRTSATALVVADGMGGAEAGEVASALALGSLQSFLDRFHQHVPQDDDEIVIRLRQGFMLAHDRIVHDSLAHPERKGMGTTLLAGLVFHDQLYVMWSGDSRAYRYHSLPSRKSGPAQGHLQMVSSDHSMVWEMVLQGELTPEEARVHPYSNVITQSLGDPKNKPRPDYRIAPLFRGDVLLLCTDGLNGMLSDEEIRMILDRQESLDRMADALVAAANAAGGSDNITLILARVVEGPERPLLEEGADVDARTTAGGQGFLQRMTGHESGHGVPAVPGPAQVVAEVTASPAHDRVNGTSGKPVPSRRLWWLVPVLSLGALGLFLLRSWSPPQQSLHERVALLLSPVAKTELGEEDLALLDSLYQGYRAGAVSERDMERLTEELEERLRIPSATGTLGQSQEGVEPLIPTDEPLPGSPARSGYWPPIYGKLLQDIEQTLRDWEKRATGQERQAIGVELRALRERVRSHLTSEGEVTLRHRKAEKEYQTCTAELKRIRGLMGVDPMDAGTIGPVSSEPAKAAPSDSADDRQQPVNKSETPEPIDDHDVPQDED